MLFMTLQSYTNFKCIIMWVNNSICHSVFIISALTLGCTYQTFPHHWLYFESARVVQTARRWGDCWTPSVAFTGAKPRWWQSICGGKKGRDKGISNLFTDRWAQGITRGFQRVNFYFLLTTRDLIPTIYVCWRHEMTKIDCILFS